MNTFLTIVVCFLAGAGAGIGTGFAGMSAAAVIGPILTVFLGLPAYQAIGIGLASDVLASASSAVTYKKHGNLDIKNSLPLLLSVIIMTVIGSFVASLMPNRILGGTNQFAMICIGMRFIIKPINNTRESMVAQNGKNRIVKSIIGGVFVGFICGFIGAGGGMMLLMVLTSFLGYEMHIAVGTSVFIMAFTALTGSISHIAIGGMPDALCLSLCIFFTLIWAKIAAVIANKASAATLNRVVGVVMILTGISIIVFESIA